MASAGSLVQSVEAPVQVAATVERAAGRKAVTAAAIGNLMEWYDYTVYAVFAGTIGAVFFSSDSPLHSLLLSFAVFGVGFGMRPLGAIVLGIYGDKVGRRNALVLGLVLMAASTVLVGILPTYHQIGLAAPLLLVALRLVQGFSAGGEATGSGAFLAEYSTPRTRGFVASWQQFGVGAGLLIGSGIATLLTNTLSKDALESWGWRVPFVAGLVIGAAGLYLRLRVEETPKYQNAAAAGDATDSPLREALRDHRRAMLSVFGFAIASAVSYYVFLTYVPSYASTVLDMSSGQTLLSNTIAVAVFIAVIPLAGILSDRIGRRPLLLVFAFGFLLLSYPLFMWLDASRTFMTLLTVQVIAGILEGLFGGVAMAAYSEFFPTRVRCIGMALPYSIGVAAFGGTAGFVGTWLVNSTGDPRSVAWYVVLSCIISLPVYLTLNDRAGEELG